MLVYNGKMCNFYETMTEK